MSNVVRTPKKKRSKALLPIMGLSLAALLAVVSYVVAPVLLDTIVEQFPKNKTLQQIDDFEHHKPYEKLPDKTPQYVFAVALWLVAMGLAMFLVSTSVGEDPEKESWKHLGPSPANKKAIAKQLKKDLKEAKKRARQQKSKKSG
jgi:hypothetical protein